MDLGGDKVKTIQIRINGLLELIKSERGGWKRSIDNPTLKRDNGSLKVQAAKSTKSAEPEMWYQSNA